MKFKEVVTVTEEVKRVPYQEGLFTWPSDEPQLIAGHCKNCDTYFFPRFNVTHKATCKKREVEDVLLSRRGKIQTFCVQHYPAPAPFINPEPFEPYNIVWVALPEGIAVAGLTTGIRSEDLKVGLEVELVVGDLGLDKNGNVALTWKWKMAQSTDPCSV